MNVKMVDLRAQFKEVEEEVKKGWNQTFENMNLMLGPNVRAFEDEFSSFIGTKYGYGVNSGTDALILSLSALGIEPADGVLTVSFTFFATPESIILAGGKPIFVDIDEDTLTIDVNHLEKILKSARRKDGETYINGIRVKGIIPVHLFGIPAPMEKIRQIATEFNLFIIEDAAQAHGALYKGKRVGSFGNTSAFSFYMSKNLSALGDAGMILTNDKEIAEKIFRLRIHGQSERYTHRHIGYNSRLDELQAVVLRAKLKKLDEWNRRRREIATLYLQGLKDLPIKLPTAPKESVPVWHMFSVKTRKRDDLFKYLRENGIEAAIHYPVPCHKQKALEEFNSLSLPVTERVSGEILSLPIHQHLTNEEVSYIIDKIKDFFG